ncbi:endolytic transglycosylase MltG [Chloroflexota bacterium]
MNKNRIFLNIALLLSIIVVVVSIVYYMPILASNHFGPPNQNLGLVQKFRFSFELILNADKLTAPVGQSTTEIQFDITEGESVQDIALRLHNDELIADPYIFQMYLIWTGLDTSVQVGRYSLARNMSSVDIAGELQDSTPEEISFNVLAGWRMEEIAASLPTSGLSITPEEFLNTAKELMSTPEFIPIGSSVEGFLFPGSYLLPRDTSANDLVSLLTQNMFLYLSQEMVSRFQLQGLNVYQAVTLASIVEREAIVPDEKTMIASVFLNRLKLGMKLESDPTVQYSLGYDDTGETWWKNPLLLSDLAFDSPYNTYIYPGLPPGPICNPDLSSLQAIAYPDQHTYLFFRARCDGSNLHSFAETFEQHLANACE